MQYFSAHTLKDVIWARCGPIPLCNGEDMHIERQYTLREKSLDCPVCQNYKTGHFHPSQ